MGIRNIPLVTGEFFHVYNRGNSKQKIFLDNEDYERFTKLLYLCNSEKRINFRDDIVDKHIEAYDFERGDLIVNIGAWVLMPNHFHIYITSPKNCLGEGGLENISRFMLKLCTSYSKYFNKKYSSKVSKANVGIVRNCQVLFEQIRNQTNYSIWCLLIVLFTWI